VARRPFGKPGEFENIRANSPALFLQVPQRSSLSSHCDHWHQLTGSGGKPIRHRKPTRTWKNIRRTGGAKRVQSEEQNWVQFTWELERVKRELEEFLALSDEQKTNSAHQLVSRLRVALARLELFVATLDRVE
jgi:hypothetical protein